MDPLSNHRGAVPLGGVTSTVAGVRVVPAISVTLADTIGPIKLDQECLQVVDLSTGDCFMAPIDRAFARTLAQKLALFADGAGDHA